MIEYGYDHAGRLTSIEGKPDADPASHSELTIYELDAYGHRVGEEQQRWDGAGWVTEAVTAYEYSTRCQLDRVIAGTGSEESVTEYAYDCAGNLERVWDANHPSAGQTAPASTEYSYDTLNRLVTVTQPCGGGGGGSVVTTYGHDVQDHLVEVTDGEGNVTTYEYSDRDLLTREVSGVTGTTTYGYNDHGELVSQTDARGVTMNRTVDELDRVTFVDYPDDTLDVAYTYDDPAVAFSLGRLTEILRNGHAVAYGYDRFGRVTSDGELTYVLDKNGNRLEIGYPGGVTAHYTYDFADRQATLDVEQPGEPLKPIVTAASYYSSGPLSGLSLGNGLTETREHDSRYHPVRITVAGASTLLDWQYTTDAEGNVTGIADLLEPANDRVYGYKDYQYFLTQGDGPWGTRSWSYDRIGNRLTEIKDGASDSYAYEQNPAMGNTPKLDGITLGSGGTRSYSYDEVGNQTEVATGEDVVVMTYDDASRLAAIERSATGADTELFYDGRGFLRSSTGRTYDSSSAIFCDGFESGDTSAWSSVVGSYRADSRRSEKRRDAPGGSALNHLRYHGRCYLTESTPETCGLTLITRILRPTYSSEGVLHSFYAETNDGASLTDRYVFYFGLRPVASLELAAASATFQYLSVDHLGTPVLATDGSGGSVWAGGFEPFGQDWQAGTPDGAHENGIFLRFPGQWLDEVWAEALLGTEVVYNVHRWYETDSGRYSRADPIGLAAAINVYSYVSSNPVLWVDPSGLQRGDFHIPTPEEIERMKEELCARQAFWHNYHHMRQANWKKSDKYFHCKANCEAARCGDAGYDEACELSDLRELADQLFGDPPSASAADQAANRFGREEARKNPKSSCPIICSKYRPRGLPGKY